MIHNACWWWFVCVIEWCEMNQEFRMLSSCIDFYFIVRLAVYLLCMWISYILFIKYVFWRYASSFSWHSFFRLGRSTYYLFFLVLIVWNNFLIYAVEVDTIFLKSSELIGSLCVLIWEVNLFLTLRMTKLGHQVTNRLNTVYSCGQNSQSELKKIWSELERMKYSVD